MHSREQTPAEVPAVGFFCSTGEWPQPALAQRQQLFEHLRRQACDLMIHTANVISAAHKRVPVCQLCKRSAATVYCKQDAACLCPACNNAVHESNPLPHTIQPIEDAMASGEVAALQAAKVLEQPVVVSDRDETSSVSNQKPGLEQKESIVTQSSEGNTSLAVVPEIDDTDAGAAVPAASGPNKDLKTIWGKDFDALDYEATWLGNVNDMGFDFSDILGNDQDAPGMVPTLPEDDPAVPSSKSAPLAPVVLDLGGPRSSRDGNPSPALVPTPSARPPPPIRPVDDVVDELEALAQEDDFVVPSFLPLEEEADPLGAFTVPETHLPAPPAVIEQLDEDSEGYEDDEEDEDYEVEVGRGRRAVKRSRTGTAYGMVLAPPPPQLSSEYSLRGAGSGPVAQVEGYNTRRSAMEGGRGVPMRWDGATMTREQRVARYREKRKNRTFQKTIRYASRKAYAEVRPRIKGRFATKEEVEAWKARQAAGIVGPEDHLMTF